MRFGYRPDKRPFLASISMVKPGEETSRNQCITSLANTGEEGE
jgi:hypothetical protein